MPHPLILSKNADLARIAERIRWGVAGEQEIMSIKTADFLAIRTAQEPHVRTSVELLEKQVAPEQGPRVRRFVASDETPDRYGDIIRVSGWDFANFKRNPVALWAHNDANPPIGTVIEFTKGQNKKGEPALLEAIDYFTSDVNPLSETVLRLIDAGGLRAVSVGFIPQKTVRPNTPEERLQMGLGPWGVEFTKVEQIELSNCSIPANPNALLSKALVPMVRDMEAAGSISRELAVAFYAAASRLEETERRVFALGAPGGSPAPAETREAPAAPPAVHFTPRKLQTNIKIGEAEARILSRPAIRGSSEDDDLDEPDGADLDPKGDVIAAEAQEIIEQARALQAEAQGAQPAAPPAPAQITLEQRVAALEQAHARLQAEHDGTRAMLQRSVTSIEGLLAFVEQLHTSGSADHTSGQGPTKSAGVREDQAEGYLAQVFAEGFREGLQS